MVRLNVRARTLPQPERLGQAVAAALVVLAWALLAAGHAAGMQGLLSHDVILTDGELPLPAGALVFVAAWQVMIAAMMLPTALPAVRAFCRPVRRRAWADLTAFLGAYFAVWTAFGVAALAVDAGLHALAESWAWLGDRPSLVAAGVLLLAAGYQFLPVKRRCLAECRDTANLAVGRGPRRAAWRTGIRHGSACLGANWALMLVVFAVGVHALWWTVLLTLVMVAEKLLPGWRSTVPAVGAGLGTASLLTALA